MRCPSVSESTSTTTTNTTTTTSTSSSTDNTTNDNIGNSQLDNVQRPSRIHTVDYSEYMWMGGDMEEFDRKVVEECMEEEFIERCFEEMHEEEEIMFNLERAIEQHPDLLNNNWVQQPYANITPIQVTDMFIFNPEAPEFIPTTVSPQR